MGEIKRYDPKSCEAWDSFVAASKNGTFLFYRAYMDYHSDRFADHSLMFFNAKGKLLALLPANLSIEKDGSTALHSHQGLTYGGFVLGEKATTEDVMEMFRMTLGYAEENNIKAFYYKQMPTCYHLYPAQEDEYALWRLGAELHVCNISSTIDLQHPYSLQYRRKRGIAKAKKLNYTIHETTNLGHFWQIVEQNLRERYNTCPVHSLCEMEMLLEKFPENIKCFVAVKDGKTEAGVVVYLCRNTVHAQYISASPTGKADGALDLLISTLIEQFSKEHYQYFDLGISNEDLGRTLNANLIAQKEGFGARGITYKQWRFLI